MSVKDFLLSLLFFLAGLVFLLLCIPIVGWIGRNVGSVPPQQQAERRGEMSAVPSYDALLPSYDMFVHNLSSTALDGLLAVEKVYWVPEDTVVGPVPDPAAFGISADPADTAEAFARAEQRLGLEGGVWSPDRAVAPGTQVRWYYDDTIFSVTWKEGHAGACFTISEVKIAHPSQFKRYLADNAFSSAIQYRPSDMAYSVNAVTAISGDFYKNRPLGTVVYQRQLYRFEGQYLDTCMVDSQGDLRFLHRGEIPEEAALRQYIEDNDILFSLCFGPVLVEGGEVAVPDIYAIGEINDNYARACICQLGPCHYLLVTSNFEPPYMSYLDLRTFAAEVRSLGVEKAYTLDGGQTAAMITGGELINSVEFGYERNISDIIYFITAIPETETALESE